MGFSDAFTRGSEEEQNLLFDDEAFYYFAIALLTIIQIPLAIIIIKPVFGYLFFSGNKKVFNRVQKGENDIKNMEKVKKQQKLKWLNFSYFIKVAIFLTICFFMMKCSQNLPNSDAIKGFDPYEILEIDASATEQQIRKAFKKMSLKLHPDKNPDDPQAAQKFILLTKAYECLTDEQMKEVCAKYGNPDGQKSFNVGIALPSFLLKKENRAGFLAIIFLILLVIIPIIVISALDSIGKFDSHGVMNQNRQLFEAYLNENFIPRNCPKVLAQSQELLQMTTMDRKQSEHLNKLVIDIIEQAEIKNIANFELTEIQDQLKKRKGMKGKKNLFISKSLVLIYAHLFRMKIHECLEKDYEYTIELIPKMCASMVDIASFFSNKYTLLRLRNLGRRQLKFMGIRCISSVIEFCQMAVQGLWEKDKDVFQIQFFADDAQKFMKNQKYPEFKELVSQPRELRNLPNWIPQEYHEKIHDEIDQFPRLKVEYKLYLDDDTTDEMTVSDIINFKVSLTRDNTPDNEDIPLVHSNKFTFLKEEVWYVIVIMNDNVIFFERVKIFLFLCSDQLRGATKFQETNWKFIPEQFLGPQNTELKMTIYVKSDSYKGLDQEIQVVEKFKTLKEVNRVSLIVEYHEDDKALDKEVPLINKLLNPVMQQEDLDSDDDDEEEEEKSKKPKQD